MATLRRRKRPSFEDRRSAANSRAAVSIALFDQAVEGLDEAAAEQSALIYEIDQKIDALKAVQEEALTDYDAATETADRIRSLIGLR